MAASADPAGLEKAGLQHKEHLQHNRYRVERLNKYHHAVMDGEAGFYLIGKQVAWNIEFQHRGVKRSKRP